MGEWWKMQGARETEPLPSFSEEEIYKQLKKESDAFLGYKDKMPKQQRISEMPQQSVLSETEIYNQLKMEDDDYFRRQDAAKWNNRQIGNIIRNEGGLSMMGANYFVGGPLKGTDRPDYVDNVNRAPSYKGPDEIKPYAKKQSDLFIDKALIEKQKRWGAAYDERQKNKEIEFANRVSSENPGLMGKAMAMTGKTTLEENAPMIMRLYEDGLRQRQKTGTLTENDRYFIEDMQNRSADEREMYGARPVELNPFEKMEAGIKAAQHTAFEQKAAENPEKYAVWAAGRVQNAFTQEENLDPRYEQNYEEWGKKVLSNAQARVDALTEYEKALEYNGRGEMLPAVREQLKREKGILSSLQKLDSKEFYFLRQQSAVQAYGQQAQADDAFEENVEKGLQTENRVTKSDKLGGMAIRDASDEELKPKLMTEEERRVYLYYAGKDPEKAEKYYQSLMPVLNERQAGKVSEIGKKFGDDLPILAAPLGWVMSPLSGLASFGAAGLHAGKNLLTGDNTPIDKNSVAYHGQAFQQGINEGMLEGHTGAGKFAIDLVNNIGQNATQLMYGPASLAAMGVSAAGQGTYDALQRGATPGKAFISGAATGGIEMATEKLPLEMLRGAADPATKSITDSAMKRLGKAGLSVLEQAGTEAAEEGIGAFAEDYADRIIMGDKSNRALAVQEYMKQGMTREEAEAKAEKDLWKEAGQNALMGAVSGGVMAGAAEGIGNTLAMRDASKVDIRDLTDAARTLGEDTASYRLAMDLQQKDTVTDFDKLKLQQQLQADINTDAGRAKINELIEKKNQLTPEEKAFEESYKDFLSELREEEGISNEVQEYRDMMQEGEKAYMDGVYGEENAKLQSTAPAVAEEKLQTAPVTSQVETTPVETAPVETTQVQTAPADGPVVGMIGYMDHKGNVYMQQEYSSAAEFRKAVQESSDSGEPITVTMFRDRNGNHVNSDFLRDVNPMTVHMEGILQNKNVVFPQQEGMNAAVQSQYQKTPVPEEYAKYQNQWDAQEEARIAWEEKLDQENKDLEEKNRAIEEGGYKGLMTPEVENQEAVAKALNRQKNKEVAEIPVEHRELNHVDDLMQETPIARGVGAGDAAELRAVAKEIKDIRRNAETFARKNNVKPIERKMAREIIANTLEMKDLPKNCRPSVVKTLVEQQTNLNELRDKGMNAIRKRNMQREILNAKEILGPNKDLQINKQKDVWQLRRLTPERVLMLTFGEKKGQEMIDYYVRPIQQNESNRVQFMNNIFDEARALKLNKEERALTQIVGEGIITTEGIKNGALTRAHLGEGVNEKEAQRILKNIGKADLEKVDNAVKWYRNTYDNLFDVINDFRARHRLKLVEKRENYFPHFEKTSEAEKIMRDLGIQGVSDLPTEIAGLTSDFRPNSRWVANFEQRKSDVTSYDAAEGFQSYMNAVSDMLYHTDDVMRLRALDAVIRGKTGKNTNQKDAYDILNDDLNAKADNQLTVEDLDKIFEGEEGTPKFQNNDQSAPNSFASFATWVTDMANVMANKQQAADRNTESRVARSMLNMSQKAAGAFGKNSVVGNISSTINNTITFPKIFATTKQKYVFQAMKEVAAGNFEKTGLAKQSEFLMGKEGVDMLVKTKGQAAADLVMQYTFAPVEKFVSESAYYAKYLECKDKGFTETDARAKANDYAAYMMARRSKGSLPLKLMAKNPFEKLTSMFQVELSNDWYSMRHDLPAYLKNVEESQGKAAATRILAEGTAKYCIYSFLLNSALEAITGYAPAPDPVRWVSEAMEELLHPNDENADWLDRVVGAGASLGDNLLQVVPEVSAAMAFMGKGNGRLPVPAFDSQKLFNGIAAMVRKDGPNYREYAREQITDGIIWPAVMTLMPFGGNQMKKTTQGLSTVVSGKMVRQGKEGEQLMTGVEQTPMNYIKGALFGKGALKEVGEYWDKDKRMLSAKQTQQAYDAQEATGMPLNEWIKLKEDMKKQAEIDKINDDKRDKYKRTEDVLREDKNLTDEQRAFYFSQQTEAPVWRNPFAPGYDADVARLPKATYEKAKAFERMEGVPVRVYQDVYEYEKTLSGENKKINMMQFIEDLDLDREEKTALFGVYYESAGEYEALERLEKEYSIPPKMYLETVAFKNDLEGSTKERKEAIIQFINMLPLDSDEQRLAIYRTFYKS